MIEDMSKALANQAINESQVQKKASSPVFMNSEMMA